MHVGQQTALQAGNRQRKTDDASAANRDGHITGKTSSVSQSHSRERVGFNVNEFTAGATAATEIRDDGRVGKMELTAQSKLQHSIACGQSDESLALLQQVHFALCLGNAESSKLENSFVRANVILSNFTLVERKMKFGLVSIWIEK